MLRMRSRHHGFMHAYNKNEEEYLRKLGWIGDTEKFPEELDSTADALVEVEKPQAKRGRPKMNGS